MRVGGHSSVVPAWNRLQKLAALKIGGYNKSHFMIFGHNRKFDSIAVLSPASRQSQINRSGSWALQHTSIQKLKWLSLQLRWMSARLRLYFDEYCVALTQLR
jgi:hypothetical protein